MSTRPSYPLILDGPLVLRVAEATPDGSGVITQDLTANAHLVVAGASLGGIEITDGGSPIYLEDDQEIALLLSSTAATVLLHESLAVATPESRLDLSSGIDGGVDTRPQWIYWRSIGGVRRWRVPVWV